MFLCIRILTGYLSFFPISARLELTEKVKRILNKQFEIEVSRQQTEIEEIENSILKVQKNLLFLRYAATRSFYAKVSSTMCVDSNDLINRFLLIPLKG